MLANTTTSPRDAAALCPRDAHTLQGEISVDVSRPRRLHAFSSANITGRSAARERRRKRKRETLGGWTDDEGETDSEC